MRYETSAFFCHGYKRLMAIQNINTAMCLAIEIWVQILVRPSAVLQCLQQVKNLCRTSLCQMRIAQQAQGLSRDRRAIGGIHLSQTQRAATPVTTVKAKGLPEVVCSTLKNENEEKKIPGEKILIQRYLYST